MSPFILHAISQRISFKQILKLSSVFRTCPSIRRSGAISWRFATVVRNVLRCYISQFPVGMSYKTILFAEAPVSCLKSHFSYRTVSGKLQINVCTARTGAVASDSCILISSCSYSSRGLFGYYVLSSSPIFKDLRLKMRYCSDLSRFPLLGDSFLKGIECS